jgi:hypothetical protein
MDNNYGVLRDRETINKTIEALGNNGINALVAENGEEAKKKVSELLPEGAEIMNMTSVTLETIGVAKEIVESSRFKSIQKQLATMDRKTQGDEMRKIRIGPDWAIGSVHAVTEDGKVIIASNTGSQLPAYAYGAGHIIWVVGAQKIVKDIEDGFKRIYNYVLPLESERANKAYNISTGSYVSKVLIVNKEIQAGRITIIIVNEVLGF